MFRRQEGVLQVLLAHPGGPFWERKDEGAWTIPKGQCDEGEELLATAIREFTEETSLVPHGPFFPLGAVRQRAGKTVHAWSFEGDADVTRMRSNLMHVEWPPNSRKMIACPEIDRYGWFDLGEAKKKINAAQAEFLERLDNVLEARTSDADGETSW